MSSTHQHTTEPPPTTSRVHPGVWLVVVHPNASARILELLIAHLATVCRARTAAAVLHDRSGR